MQNDEYFDDESKHDNFKAHNFLRTLHFASPLLSKTHNYKCKPQKHFSLNPS